MNNEAVKTINKTIPKVTRTIITNKVFLIIMLVALAILLYTFLKPVELRTYELPSELYPGQELFREQEQDSIYIPGVKEVIVDRLSDYLLLKMKYGSLLQEFEQTVKVDESNDVNDDPPGKMSFDEELSDSQLFVALPAYIAGSNEADRPVQYGYEFEILTGSPEITDHLTDTTIVTIDGHPPTLEKVNEILASKDRHHIKARSNDGKIVSVNTSFYGAYVYAHYTINELWKFSRLMRFDLADINGNSGGAATAYEVMLRQKGRINKHGKFVITGAIDVEGNISGVGGVKAKTYLTIKNQVPVMFVPQINYAEATEMKSLMKSNIDIVPIQKLGDIEAYWSKEALSN